MEELLNKHGIEIPNVKRYTTYMHNRDTDNNIFNKVLKTYNQTAVDMVAHPDCAITRMIDYACYLAELLDKAETALMNADAYLNYYLSEIPEHWKAGYTTYEEMMDAVKELEETTEITYVDEETEVDEGTNVYEF